MRTKIVPPEVDAVCCPQILPLLRERICQPREAAHLHSDREVLALHMRRAHFRGIGIAHDWDLLRMRCVDGTIAALAFGIFRVDLDDLGEVMTWATSQRR